MLVIRVPLGDSQEVNLKNDQFVIFKINKVSYLHYHFLAFCTSCESFSTRLCIFYEHPRFIWELAMFPTTISFFLCPFPLPSLIQHLEAKIQAIY